MAYIHKGVLVVLSLLTLSFSQQDDPISGFCRRWGHTTAQVGSRLYIDGGMVGSVPFTSNRTNPWLLYSDLNTSTVDAGMPMQYANLSKPGNIPSVSGGYTWSDNTNQCFYQFGGEYPDGVTPADYSMWTYDVVLNTWNSTKTTGDKQFERVSYGAGTHVEERGLGFYFGGWISNKTTLGWKGPPMATNGLVQFDMSTGDLQNMTGPDDISIGRAEGQLLFLPVSDSGMLIYFGGIEDPYHNGSYNAANMSIIHIYDMASSKWYTQTASGSIPAARRQFCADVTWPDDQSSFNVYLYGGFGASATEAPGFDDAYILSIPSFTWIKAFPLDGSDSQPSQVGHGGCSANMINRAQMLIIGGWFPLYDKCDAPAGQGQHNMVPGFNGGEAKLWDKFDPKLTNYVVPSPIVSAIGGGPTGGATKTAPASWGHVDLATYFTLKPSFTARSATRSLLSPTETSSPVPSKKTNVGAIAGGVVGGLAALIIILCLILFCLHRRKKALREKQAQADEPPPPPPPAELATTVPYEMPATTDASNHDYNSPYPAQGPPSYGNTPPYTSPVVEAAHNSHPSHAEMHSPDERAMRNSPPAAWSPQMHYAQSGTAAEGQYSYPTPVTPRQSPNDSIQQQVPIYYPRPTDPSTPPLHTPRSFSDETRYTPHGSPGRDNRRVNDDRRPVHGRFVEEDYM